MREYARYEGPGWKQETHSEANHSEAKNGSNSLGWFLLGIGVGAGVALLFASATGSEVRNALAYGYRRTIDGVSRGTQQLRQRGSNLISLGRRPGRERS